MLCKYNYYLRVVLVKHNPFGFDVVVRVESKKSSCNIIVCANDRHSEAVPISLLLLFSSGPPYLVSWDKPSSVKKWKS